MTTNYKIIVALATVIIFALALFGAYRFSQNRPGEPKAQASPQPASGFEALSLPQTSPTSQSPATGPEDEVAPNIGISLTAPWPSATITSPLKIEGFANVETGAVAIVVKDVYGKVLGQGKASACFAKNPCPFSASVVFAHPETQTGTIEVFSPSPKSGAKEYLQIIKINF